MSDLNTTYVYFNAYDFKQENVLSSYALSATPLTFVPELTEESNNRVLWHFGDGTTSKMLCASKTYDFPGEYTVNLVVYDCYSNALVSSYSQVVTVYDFVPFTFDIRVNDIFYFLQPLSAGGGFYLSPELSAMFASYNFSGRDLANGKIHGPYPIRTFYPPYQPPSNIFYTISGSYSTYYFEVSSNKFSHLENTYSLFETLSNVTLSANQFQEVNKITPVISELYAKIGDGRIQQCSPTDSGAFFVGLSGYKDVFFKDDSVSNFITIELFFDRTNNYSPEKYDKDVVTHLNNLSIVLTANIVDNLDINHLSITSNGIDGEGTRIRAFEFPPIKFSDTKIPFVVKINDSDNFAVKNFPSYEVTSFGLSSTFGLQVLSGGNLISNYYYTLCSLNDTLSAQTHYGSARGFIEFINTPLNEVIYDVKLVLSATVLNDQLSAYTIVGETAHFDLYPQDYYSIAKKNEDFDMSQTYKDLRFQETLLDKHVLFDDFLGTIVGTLTSDHESLGKKVYEKIANFVENTQDVDRDEVFSLLSQLDMLGAERNIYDSTSFNYPEEIRRLINLASIGKNKLFGTPNKFAENFDAKGQTSKTIFGTNIGNQINNNTHIISAGTPLVALEKFSGDYVLLNTSQPVSALSGATTYMLSSYADTWGWPLVLPIDFVYTDFPKYYFFFEYVDGFDSTNSDFTIDFDNDLTTVPQSATYTEVFGVSGIFVNMFIDTLYDALSLYDS